MLRKIKSTILVAHLGTLLFLFLTACKKLEPMAETQSTQQDTISKEPKVMARLFPQQDSVNIPADLLAAFPGSSWMSKIPNKVKISHLSIPGTANSGETRYQTKSFTEQLEMGVRLLQIYIRLDAAGVLYVGNSTITFRTFLENVHLFLAIKGVTETVVIMLGNYVDPISFNNSTSIRPKPIVEKIKATLFAFQNKIYKWPNFYNTTTQTAVDWPSMGDVRGKMLLLSLPGHSEIAEIKDWPYVRAIRYTTTSAATLAINAGWTSDGNKKVTAELSRKSASPVASIEYNESTIVNSLQVAESPIFSLYLTETGVKRATPLDEQLDIEYINPIVEDFFELQYKLTPNYGRFGMVSMHQINKYQTQLIYLTNFNRITKTFKQKVTKGGWDYSADGSLPSYPMPQLASNYSETQVWLPASVWAGDFVSPKRWMSKIPDNTLLSAINIPGTHDAGTSTGSVLGKTQDWTIQQQLENGIRYIDLRLLGDDEDLTIKGKLIVHHGAELYRNISADDVFNTITAFLDANPSETIVLSASVTDEGLTAPNANNLFMNEVGDRLRYFWQGSAQTTTYPTMGQLRGRIFLMTSPESITRFPYMSVKFTPPLSTPGERFEVPFNGSTKSFLGWASAKYEGLGLGLNGSTTPFNIKWSQCVNSFSTAQQDADKSRLYLTGIDYSQPNPKTSSDYLNPKLREYLKLMFQGNWKVGRHGIITMDFADLGLSSGFYLTNFTREEVMNSF